MNHHVVVTAAVVALFSGGADAFASPAGMSLSVAPRAGAPAELALVARGSRAGAAVAFFVVSTEFKRARVPIGVAKAASDGTARIRYTPTWSGTEQFVARLAELPTGGPEATVSYRVTASVAGPLAADANPGRPLASVGHTFLTVILTLVGLVWLTLIAMLALAIGWLPRLATEGD